MAENPILSIIVPVYNSEKYLSRCIDSILCQAFRNFECILINDGSTDSSPQICEAYAKKDKRINVIHKNNAGVSAARNDGIKAASGDYIAFVDSDDYVHKEAYERMHTAISAQSADVVCCAYSHRGINYSLPTNYYSGPQAETVYYLEKADLFGTIWNKLYKTGIIKTNSIQFAEGRSFGEDFLFNLSYFSFITNVCCLEDILYYYNENDASISKKRPGFEQSLFRFNNTSRIIIGFTEANNQRFHNRILAKDFTYTVFLIRNIYIPKPLMQNERKDLLLTIKRFYIEHNAIDAFVQFKYSIFYRLFICTPISLFDFILNGLFKIIFKIRGYS